jgi:cytochrome c oxidase subunit 2
MIWPALHLLIAKLSVAGLYLAGILTPESGGSPNADRIHGLYTIVGILGVIVFLAVEAFLIGSLIKYRRRGRHGPEPVPVHGNAPLEIGWTLGAIVLVTVIAVVTFIYLPGIMNPERSSASGLKTAAQVPYAVVGQPEIPKGSKALQIHINGQQYIWRYDYVSEKPLTEARPVYAYTDMVVPVGVTVILKIYSSDVAHSWWIPKLGGKADAIPGHTNETWFQIKKPGVYEGRCAELCGENHADMRARVIGVPVDEYNAWIDQHRRDIIAAQDELAAQRKAGFGDPLSNTTK